MEYSRVRRSLSRTESDESAFRKNAKDIVAGLKMRQVQLPGISYSSNTFGKMKSRIISEAGLKLKNQVKNQAVAETEDQIQRLDRARKRQEERREMKEKLIRDMDVLREQEEEDKRSKHKQMLKVLDQDRRRREEQLQTWKIQMEAKQIKKQEKEDRKRDKEKKIREDGLRQRQEKYFAELKQGEKFQKTISTIPSRRDEKQTINPIKERIETMRNNYDPNGKYVALKSKTKKHAKFQTDAEITELAKRIVEEATISKHQEDLSHDINHELALDVGETLYEDYEIPNHEEYQFHNETPTKEPSTSTITEDIEAWYKQQLANVNLD